MSISVTCPECGYGFSVRDEYAGRRGKCPQCGGAFRAEAAEFEEDEFPAIVTNGSGRTNGSSRRNGASTAASSLANVATTAPSVGGGAATSVASAYAARRRSSSMPGWGWIAIGVMLLVAGGAIGGAWALAPDPLEVKDKVNQRSARADKAFKAFEKEVLDKVDDTYQKLPAVEADVKEFARPKTIDEDVMPGIVKVVNVAGGGPRGHGTGWIANDQHWIITNHHVVEGCESLYVITADGKKHDIEGVIADNPDWDLAIIKPKEKIPGGKPLKILPNDGTYLPSAGDTIWAVGNPATHLFTAARGIISRRVSERQLQNEGNSFELARRGSERDIMWLSYDARTFPGNSGGPILDENFRVIGVTTLGIMTVLQRSMEAAKEAFRTKKDRSVPSMLPTLVMASNSMYVLQLMAEHSDGKVLPFSSISNGH
ncbi:MAG: trypsin-like peptidase domain-containing protein [Pirellulales bacterium]